MFSLPAAQYLKKEEVSPLAANYTKNPKLLCRSQWNPDTALYEGHIVSAEELTVLLQPVFTQNPRNLILFLQDTVCSINSFSLTNAEYKSLPKWDAVAPTHQSILSVFQLSIDDFTYLSESYGNKNPLQNVQASISLFYFFICSI